MASALRIFFAAITVAFGLAAGGAAAQNLSHDQIVARENNITVRVVSGGIGDTSAQLAADLALVLDDPEKLRILPMLSGGGMQNVADLLYLKGVDVGFVRSDVLSYAKQQRVYSNVENRIRFISKLYLEEIHVLAGSSIASMNDLVGKRVNFGRAAAGKKATPELVFETLGIPVQPVYLDPALAFHQLKTGEIAATVMVNAKPNDVISTLSAEDGLKLLSIDYADGLQNLYLPASLTNEDYPNLIPAGTTVDTLATNVVMAMYNWPRSHVRYRRVSTFVKSFFGKFAELRKSPRHPKWREVNLAALMPGWERFGPAKEWLDVYGTSVPGEHALSKLRLSFEGFLKQRNAGQTGEVSQEEKTKLFRTFLSWEENKTEATIHVHKTSPDGVGKFVGTIKAQNTEISVAGTQEKALLLTPDLRDLTPGPHAFHVHSKPGCGPGEKDGVVVAGLGAGGHLFLEVDGKTYGYHLGDLPDLAVAGDGTATQAVIAPRLTLADLLNRSIMVHDTQSDSSGRQACGVID
ncbi:MAG: TAXI family TRAP transporter solute-binding subunit [Hyphomicrobiales bacterium]